MLLAVDVDIVGVGDVIALGTASYVDEAVDGLALAKSVTDALLGVFNRDVRRHDKLDVEILGVDDLLLFG